MRTFKYIILLALFVTLIAGVGANSVTVAAERTARTISQELPQRDDQIDLEPGESQLITKNIPLEIFAERVELEVTGEDAQYVTVELDRFQMNEIDNSAGVDFIMTLSEDAPWEQRLSVVVVMRFYEGENIEEHEIEYFIDVPEMPPLGAYFTAEVVNQNPPFSDIIEGEPNIEIQFSDESSGDIQHRFWQFGDGEVSNERDPLHRYPEPGYYTVSLTVTAPNGEQDELIWKNLVWVREDAGVYLTYENRDDIGRFITIPSDRGFADDTYYNVRFTPPFHPFKLLQAHIGLFSVDSLALNTMGEPGMRVIVWQSGEFMGEPGFPVEAIDSVDVPYEKLGFGGDRNHLMYNVVDLEPLNISFDGQVDFHVGIDVLQNENTEQIDTLSFYTDEGREFNGQMRQTVRTYFWNGEYGEWMMLNNEDGGFDRPYAAFIRVLVEFYTDVDESTELLYPDGTLPQTILIDPAYPNPFNAATKVRFRVPFGQTYHATIMDMNGREIEYLSNGVGGEVEQINVNLQNHPAGTYYLKIQTPNQLELTPLMYVK